MLTPGSLVLVTGANGFVGSHLVEELLACGHRVRCLVRRTSDLTFIHGLPVEWAHGDLCAGSELDAACHGVDAVCHCAALTRALDEATFLRVNAAGTEALAHACLRTAPGLSRFLFVSSIAACGPALSADQPVDEDCPPHPINWYGKSKLTAEEALMQLGDRLPVTIVRPVPVFGPRDRDFLAYFRLVKYGLNLQVGREARWSNLIYVEDLVSLIILALASDAAIGRLYLACGSAHTRQEFAESIARALHRRPTRISLPLAALPLIGAWSRLQARLTGRPALVNDQRIIDLKVRYWLFSGARACQELGFVPKFGLDTAVAETARWYQDHGWL